MGGIITLYLDKEFQAGNYEDILVRLAEANKISLNKQILKILVAHLEANRRFVDKKITDFEVQLQNNVNEKRPLCKHCFSMDMDVKGFVIHDKGCPWQVNYEGYDF